MEIMEGTAIEISPAPIPSTTRLIISMVIEVEKTPISEPIMAQTIEKKQVIFTPSRLVIAAAGKAMMILMTQKTEDSQPAVEVLEEKASCRMARQGITLFWMIAITMPAKIALSVTGHARDLDIMFYFLSKHEEKTIKP